VPILLSSCRAEPQPDFDVHRFGTSAERNLIERFLQCIKQFRSIATRYEKTARNFLAGLHLVCAWLGSNEDSL
jgi:transposase